LKKKEKKTKERHHLTSIPKKKKQIMLMKKKKKFKRENGGKKYENFEFISIFTIKAVLLFSNSSSTPTAFVICNVSIIVL